MLWGWKMAYLERQSRRREARAQTRIIEEGGWKEEHCRELRAWLKKGSQRRLKPRKGEVDKL